MSLESNWGLDFFKKISFIGSCKFGLARYEIKIDPPP